MIRCMSDLKPFPKPIATIVFFIGLFYAVSFRLIIIVQHAHPSYVRIFWYLAVLSNLIFFMFRYHICLKRKRAIHANALIPKLSSNTTLQEHDKKALLYIVTSIERSREGLNYLCIAILSMGAIIIDIILSL